VVKVELPDGTELQVEEKSTVQDVARQIGEGLARDAVAGVVNGDLVDTDKEVDGGDEIKIVTEDSEEYTKVLRHSAAHVFAQALKDLRPNAKLAIGPYTEDGFYYDIGNVNLDEEDLKQVEEKMERIVEKDYKIKKQYISREQAQEKYQDNKYKKDILSDEASDKEVSIYKQGDFEDLCKGPHVESTGKVKAFELTEIAGAYWRGDESNKMLTRVYGTAFSSEHKLEEHIQKRKQAEERNHRRIGSEMNLFSIPDHSPGCVHFHRKGMKIRRELEDFIREKNSELGYEEVNTPELNRANLWKKTGHYAAFKEEGEMFAWEQNGEEYGLKPMNCANHSHIFSSGTKSYRDLPVKLSEFGTVYRNEQSGELSGLMRVRGLTQDDGHAFIQEQNIQQEVTRHLNKIVEMYQEFGMDVNFILETEPGKSQGPEDLWRRAENSLTSSLEKAADSYEVKEGEGAFYGPKIGVEVEDAIGRQWQLGTVQLDFVIPRNYGITYVGKDNEEHHPVMIHRAILGSIERFMGVMIEHYGGDFPTWLAPEQVRVLPVSDDNMEYAKEVSESVDARTSVETRSLTVGKKIQQAHNAKVPYMLIVGSDEEEGKTVSVRDRNENETTATLEEFKQHLKEEIDEKKKTPSAEKL
jgi:threonyl-tRNA synthetase